MKQTRDEVIVNAEQVRLDAERAIVALKNLNALFALMSDHKILIPTKRLPFWRPTTPSKGNIDGVHEALTIIATDGVLGWFLTFDGEAWCGHIQCFTSEIKPLFSVQTTSTKPKRPKAQKSKRQLILESI